MESLTFNKTEYVEIESYYVNKHTRVVVTSDKVIIENKHRFLSKHIVIDKNEITNYYSDERNNDYIIRHGKGKDVRLNFETLSPRDNMDLNTATNNKALLENAIDRMLRRN